jgi:hypothetical protein
MSSVEGRRMAPGNPGAGTEVDFDATARSGEECRRTGWAAPAPDLEAPGNPGSARTADPRHLGVPRGRERSTSRPRQAMPDPPDRDGRVDRDCRSRRLRALRRRERGGRPAVAGSGKAQRTAARQAPASRAQGRRRNRGRPASPRRLLPPGPDCRAGPSRPGRATRSPRSPRR